MIVFRFIMALVCLLAFLPDVTMTPVPVFATNCLQDGATLDCRHRQLSSVPKIPPEVTKVLLDNNNIDGIQNYEFAGATQLEVISLSYNRISSLPVNAFQGLTNLRFLHLGHNNMCLGDDAYPPGVFHHLKSLETLNMASNNCGNRIIQKYPREAFKDLKNVESLAITGLPANQNSLDGFEYMSKLKTLMFVGTGSSMGTLPCNYFSPLLNITLKRLSLRNAGLTGMCQTVLRQLQSLSYLNIACNAYFEYVSLLPVLFNMVKPSLKTLSMDMIGYRGAEVGDYYYYGLAHSNLNNLKRISMRQIGNVFFNTDTIKTLANAEVIVLGHSFIQFDDSEPHVPERVEAIFNNSKLVTIALPYFKDQKYPLQTFEKEMCEPDEIDLEDHLYFPMSDQYTPKFPVGAGLDNMKKSEDNKSPSNGNGTSHNLLTPYNLRQREKTLLKIPPSYPRDTFDKLLFKYLPPSVKSLYLDNCQPTVIQSLFNLDINQLNNVQYLNLSTMSSAPEMDLFENLKKFQNLALFEAKLCQISSIETIFPPLPNLVAINLDNNSVASLVNPFQNIPRVERISLQGNRISTMGEEAFSNLTKLRKILLAHNSISSTYLNVADASSLQEVDISWNKVPYLSERFIKELNKHHSLVLNVKSDQMTCDCNALPFIKWVQATNITIVDKDSLTCEYRHNSTRILNINIDHLRVSCYKWLMPLCIALGTVFVIGLIMAIAYKNKWTLFLKYYLAKRRWRIYSKRIKSNLGLLSYNMLAKLENTYEYDAFMAHDNDDYEWVSREFCEKVEETWGRKLCIAKRDCLPGEPVFKTIVDAIDQSKLVICLLTPGFAKSNWCDFELKLALDRGKSTVIFILKDHIPWDQSTKLIRQIIYSRQENSNFLEHTQDAQGQELFWNQLRERLTQN